MILLGVFLLSVLSFPFTQEFENSNCIKLESSRWCFSFHSEVSTFENAKSRCKETNSSLATIPNHIVNEFVRKFLSQSDNQTSEAWIGLHWSYSILRWTSGYPAVANTFWKESPKFLSGRCVTISSDGSWSSRECSELYPFLCSSEEKLLKAELPSEFYTYECPPDFHLLGNRCLRFFSEEKVTQSEANSACSELDAYLLTIQSFREQDLLLAMLADHPSSYWLGLTRNGSIHFWSNPSESEVLYTNWMAGEPSGNPTKNCSLLYTTSASLGQWTEANCLTKAHFICDIVPRRVPAHPDSHLHDRLFVQGRCASGFYEYRSTCYTLTKHTDSMVRSANLLPDAVSTACNEIGLSKDCSDVNAGSVLCPIVMSPKDQLHAAFQRSLIDKFGYPSDSAWVGLKVDKEYVYADTPGFLETTALLDHSIHNALSNTTICITLNKDKVLLTFESCESHLPAVCGYFLDSHSLIAFPRDSDINMDTFKCKEGWHRFNSFCYHVEVTTPLSWRDAEIACLQDYGHLVSIGSEAEDNFVRSILPSTLTENPWIGLRVSHYRGSSLMEWSDGAKVSYDRFSEVRNPTEKDECVRLDVINGEHKWTPAVDCVSLAPFVCKAHASSINIDWNIKGSSHCLLGSRPEFCFSLNRTAVKFRDAATACRTHGLYIATILDDSQQDFVSRTVRTLLSPELGRNPPQRYWIGLLRSHGILQWLSGYPAVPNVYWKTGAEKSDGICVYLDVGLDTILNWGAANCEEKYPFLCSTVPPLPQSSPTYEVSTHEQQFCPLGFLHVRGKCYKVEGDKHITFTFSEALVKCSRSGGRLATISSLYEQDIITVLIAQRFISFWIGLNTGLKGRKWVNQDPITYTNWLEGYPKWNNFRSSLCTYVLNEPVFIGRWAEANCNEKKGFICETEPTEVPAEHVVTPHLFSQDDCLPGFQHHRGACYMVLQTPSERDSSQFHDGLSATCAATVPTPLPCDKTRGLSGCPVVMTPHSQAEAALMRLLVGDKYSTLSGVEVWTGIKLLNKNNLNIARSEDGASLGDVDIDLTRVGSSTDNVETYSCISLRTDRSFLTSGSCSQSAYAVCGYYLDTHTLHPQVANSNDFACPIVTERVGRNCIYGVDPSKRMTWLSAENYCKFIGQELFRNYENVVGHLPSVHDIATLQFLSRFHGDETTWLGLSSIQIHSSSNGSWSDTIFRWSDGSPVDYLAFSSPNETMSFMELLSCAAVDRQFTSWKSVDCFSRHAFSCQFPLEAFPKYRVQSNSEYLPAVKKCPIKFSIETKEACYAVVQSPLSQKQAHASCRLLDPGASLASFHSENEEKDLLALISVKYTQDAYWIGLIQSGLQYAWMDSSIVNYVPNHGVGSESSRLWHFQNCFTLNRSYDVSSFPPLLRPKWSAADCSTQRPYICQIYLGEHGPNTMGLAHPVRSDLPVLNCPPGFRQHEDRCFKFFPTVASFKNAEAMCRKTLDRMGFIGSLARISNSREQDFVAGLFAAEAPSQPSMAWIGLRQGDEKSWNDGSEVTFVRWGLDFPAPIDHSFEDEENGKYSCTVMLYSSNVHFHGLWSRSSCALRDQNFFLCQAVPNTTSPSPIVHSNLFNFLNVNDADSVSEPEPVCPHGYSLAFYNRSALARGDTLSSPPHCLQLVTEAPMTWEEARSLCQEQSASLPSIDSLSDLNYLRSWMLKPRSLGGAGLSGNASIWLDLQIPKCPQCYSNWTWHSGDAKRESPVLITDWFDAPANPSGCYLFTATPQSNADLGSPKTIHLRSMRPASSCTDVKLPVVCQTAAHISPGDSILGLVSSLPTTNTQRAQGLCLKNPTPELSSIETFRSNHNVAKSGRKCIRWDLVRQDFNRSDAVLPRYWRISTSEIAYSEHGSPFWADHCAHLATDQGNPAYRYACYTSTDAKLGLEDCEMQSCEIESAPPPSIIPLGWIIFIALACLGISVLITICIVRVKHRQRFLVPRNNHWLSPLKVTSSSSVFGGAMAAEHQQQQHSVLYSEPGALSVRGFGEVPALVATNPSLVHSLSPSLTLKQSVCRPLHDRDPLLLDEPDNADEFSGPV